MTSRGEEIDLLLRGAGEVGADLGAERAALLIRFLDLLYFWNPAAGLTTVAREDAVRLHLLDSLAVVPHLPLHGRVADLGTGAGLPGIPLAVARSSAHVVLVESRRKKCTFLSEAVRRLGLGNCSVLERDVRSLHEFRGAFDAVVARAFLAPRQLVEIADPLLSVGGRVVIMAARRDSDLDELGEYEPALARRADRSFRLFGGTEQRRIVVLEKLK